MRVGRSMPTAGYPTLGQYCINHQGAVWFSAQT